MVSTWRVDEVKYGPINDTDDMARFMKTLKASTVFKNKSGKFIINSSGDADIAVAGSTELQGYAITYDHTVSASVTEYADIIHGFGTHFVLPASGTYADTMRGLTCDLLVSSNIQKANVAASTTDVIVIYDGNATLGLVEVGLNPLKMYVTGVV